MENQNIKYKDVPLIKKLKNAMIIFSTTAKVV